MNENSRTVRMKMVARVVGFLGTITLAACASSGGSTGGTATTPEQTQQRSPTNIWPVKTRSHVDLWLHGYAMLLVDTASPPVFRRGYRERIRGVKAQRGIT